MDVEYHIRGNPISNTLWKMWFGFQLVKFPIKGALLEFDIENTVILCKPLDYVKPFRPIDR
jgi:hypothetical protein